MQLNQFSSDSRQWSAQEKLLAIAESHALTGEELSQWYRMKGIFEHQLKSWKREFIESSEKKNSHAQTTELKTLKDKNKALEAYLKRKNKALAESAALLVLSKKVQCVDFGRGRLTETSTSIKLLELIGEATASGARPIRCCEVIGLSYATYLRWWKNKDLSLNVDKRLKEHRTYFEPKNKLSEFEYHMLNCYLNCEEYKHLLSPIQIVPRLMDDKGIYIASESTFYRFMRLTGQNTHRGSTRKPRASNKPNELVATASNQVYCWDITYLNSNVKGQYFYLYMYIDIFDKYITGWQVFDSESAENASLLIQDIYEKENIQPNQQGAIKL